MIMKALNKILKEIRSTDLLNIGYYTVRKTFSLYYNNEPVRFKRGTIIFFDDKCRLYLWVQDEGSNETGEWTTMTLTPKHTNFDFMSLGVVNGYDVFEQINNYLIPYDIQKNPTISPLF